jgi:ubiquinone/menaquinone biosynthesis C-methylase UbiE
MDAVSLLFKLWSPIYDRPIFQRTFYRKVHAKLLAQVIELGGTPRRVVDLGCGTAQLTVDLKERWPDALVVGADLSDAMLGEARARLGAAAPPLVQANVYALPFATDSLDLITSSISYHWYTEPRRALEQIHRVLRPGGHFALATISSVVATRRLPRMRLTTLDQTRADFAAAGLRVISTQRMFPTLVPPVSILVGEKA